MQSRRDEIRRKLLQQLQRDIQPGLTRLPLELGIFADFRRGLLSTASQPRYFPNWQPQDHDPGLMLLEMWAYVCDVISFYEAQLTGEAYLRTAQRRPSLRRLVGLLGYTPRPAVASQVTLAVTTEGYESLVIPAGTALKSDEVDGGPPQIFEVTSDTKLEPAWNHFDVTSSPPGSLAEAYGDSTTKLHLKNRGVNLRRNEEFFVVNADGDTMKASIEDRREIRDVDGQRLVELRLREPLSIGDDKPGEVRLLKAARLARSITIDGGSSEEGVVILDALYPEIRADQEVILEWGEESWLLAVESVLKRYETEVTAVDEDEEYEAHFPRTVLKFDASSFPGPDETPDNVYFHLLEGGRMQLPSRRTLEGGAASFEATPEADLDDLAELAEATTRSFGWMDARGRGAITETEAMVEEEGLVLSPAMLPPMRLPLRGFGNLVEATHGESVDDEVLGSGDGSQANQSFELSQSPLTYLSTPSPDTAHGMTSTLSVFVDGVRWREVPYFFGVGPNDRVYTVREDDDGVSTITFGDGRRGARLPTGRDNVVAHYRVGAGRAAPKSGQIEDWIDKPEGVKEVFNPLAAGGGDDPQNAGDIRRYAPASALLFGRAISLRDLEAAALDTPGIDAVHASWRWHRERQTPVATIWYLGSVESEEVVAEELRTMIDPAMSLTVFASESRRATITLEIVVEEERASAPIEEAIYQGLVGEGGLLLPERIGIGGALFSSQVFETIWAVEGVVTIRKVRIEVDIDSDSPETIELDGESRERRRLAAGHGRHFDFDVDRDQIKIKREE